MNERQATIQSKAISIAEKLPGLLLKAERIATTIEQGVHNRRKMGPGESFWQYRLYDPGDEMRRIDWRQSAKSDRLYLRQMEWSAAQSVYIWCDMSSSMDFASDRKLSTKKDMAQIMCLALTQLLARGGERVALLSHRLERPISGKAALEIIGNALMAEEANNTTQPTKSFPPLVSIPSYAHVILISDFLAPLGEWSKLLTKFASLGCRGHLMQILDPSEIALPYRGRIRFEGSEGEGALLMSRTEAVREDYQAALQNHWLSLKEIASNQSWGLTRYVTDQSATASLLHLYRWLASDQGFR